MTTRDDQLLDVLAASLAPPPDTEPSWAEISHLHRVIDTTTDGRARPARTPLWRLRQPIAAAAAGVLLLGGASAAAAVSGVVMPQPVREAARAVGLPVDSPALAGAKAALARLRDALADQPRDLNAIRTDAQDVRDRLARLSADDRSHVEDEAAFLLAAADAALAPPPTTLDSQQSAPGTSPISAVPATPSNAAPAGDDHGGGPGPSANSGHSSGADDHSQGDDHSGSSATPSASSYSGPGSSGSSGNYYGNELGIESFM
ncbi:MAG: hypothetical protein ACJ780_08305 [Solirubrobacteraceae bacterium]